MTLQGSSDEADFDSLLEEINGTRVKTELIIRLLGIQNCVDTVVGNSYLRGVSGGERKRVTSAEMLVGTKVHMTWPPVIFASAPHHCTLSASPVEVLSAPVYASVCIGPLKLRAPGHSQHCKTHKETSRYAGVSVSMPSQQLPVLPAYPCISVSPGSVSSYKLQFTAL